MFTFTDNQIASISSNLAEIGYIILPHCVSDEACELLYSRISKLTETQLKTAGIGRHNQQQKNTTIRRDKISWLDNSNPIDTQYLQLMESLRKELNKSLFLGLFDYEAHYAVYQKGDFYKQHIDALKGKSNRVLSSVLYLNENWQKEQGGELILYNKDNEKIQTVIPDAGSLVIFLSEEFPHEVLAASQIRYSIAGWFRVNASASDCIDTSI